MKGTCDSRVSVSAVFAFLGNDVRLAILESLYDRTVAAGPMTESATYSAIREDAGVADSGRFSYHLDKLTDRFVAKTTTATDSANPAGRWSFFAGPASSPTPQRSTTDPSRRRVTTADRRSEPATDTGT